MTCSLGYHNSWALSFLYMVCYILGLVFFFMCYECFACVYVHCVHAWCTHRPAEGAWSPQNWNWSYRGLWAALWMPETGSQSPGRAARALKLMSHLFSLGSPDFKLLVSVNGLLTRLSCLMATVSLSENKAMLSVLYTHIFTAFTCYASVPILGIKSILQICGVIKSMYIKSPILRFI